MRETAKKIRSRIVLKMRRLLNADPDVAMREIAVLMSSYLDAGGDEDEYHRIALACIYARDSALRDAFRIADDEIRNMRDLLPLIQHKRGDVDA